MSTSEKPSSRSEWIFNFGVIGLWAGVLCAIVIPNFQRPIENPNRYSCINNLRMIDGAKQTWGLEGGKGPGDVPTWADILPYIGRGGQTNGVPKCPQGGVYSLGPLSNHPTCSFPGHVLP